MFHQSLGLVTQVYLGDWHKHPGDLVEPSQGDAFTARDHLRDKVAGAPYVLVILATVFAIKVGICAFLLHRLRVRFRSRTVKKLERTPLQKRLARIGRME